jgi:hypothetical protein
MEFVSHFLLFNPLFFTFLDGKQANDCTLTISHDALSPSTNSDRDVYVDGTLLLCNTLKDFTNLDLKAILEQEAEKVSTFAKALITVF